MVLTNESRECSGSIRKYVTSDGMHEVELTNEDVAFIRTIRECVKNGHDVEVRGAPDGSMKLLEIKRKNIAVR